MMKKTPSKGVKQKIPSVLRKLAVLLLYEAAVFLVQEAIVFLKKTLSSFKSKSAKKKSR
jgi:hypothetical protein